MQTQGIEPRDFRLYLQSELIRRCKANPRYSLRAFAQKLKIGPSFLSKLLNGKRRVTPTLVQRLAPELGLSPEQLEDFALVAGGQGARAIEALAAAQAQNGTARRELEFHQLTLDSFAIVADWYHYAILELLDVAGFEPDARWIAQALGITVNEANFAVERLKRVGMIEITPEGRWICGTHNTTVGNAFTAVAFRKLQKQVLEQALTALEELPLEERDQSSVTMSFDSRLLPQAKDRIKNFRRELAAYLQGESRGPAGRVDRVYQLSVSLFPISKEKKK